MENLFVTKELLERYGACQHGIDWFEKEFQDGVELCEETIAKIKEAPTEFVWWFYNNVQQDKRLYPLYGVNESNGVNGSDGVNRSYGVNESDGVSWSDGVNESDGVSWSDGVNGSNGVNGSDGVNESYGVLNSYGVDRAIFLSNQPRRYSIFGKEVTEERYEEAWNDLFKALKGWSPTFNNIKAIYLKNGSDWKKTPIHQAKELSKKEAWAGMPKEAVELVQSWPEFDAEMFQEITGIEVEG